MGRAARGDLKAMSLSFAVALVGVAAGAFGCGGGGGTGSVEVIVKDVSMEVVASATVTTEPATRSATTDGQGRARFDGIPARTYTVHAVHPSMGAASGQVSLVAGAESELTLILRKTSDADAGVQPSDARADSVDRDGGDAAGETAQRDPSILLHPLTKDSNGVDLSWATTGTFVAYRVYRALDATGGFTVIDVLNDAAVRTYRDTTSLLGGIYRYRLGGVVPSGGEVLSNTEMITTGVSIAVNSQVQKMKCDPKRPYLYAIDKVNNSLHFINLTQNTLEKTIFVGSAPTDLDINIAGTELFVANSGSTEIAVVDLATQTKSRSLLVDVTVGGGRGNPTQVVCTAGDTLVFGGLEQYNLKLVNANTGANITTVSASYSQAGLLASPDGTRVYATTYYLTRFDIVGATMRQVDATTDFGSSITSVVGSRDGAYLFYGNRKILATNLKSLLGTFPEIILAANKDGTVAVGATRIYDGTTFAAKVTLPLSTTVMAMTSDDKTLYLYQQASSRIFTYKLP
jgi:DNA-binding beta-propeller fold protein YncE